MTRYAMSGQAAHRLHRSIKKASVTALPVRISPNATTALASGVSLAAVSLRHRVISAAALDVRAGRGCARGSTRIVAHSNRKSQNFKLNARPTIPARTQGEGVTPRQGGAGHSSTLSSRFDHHVQAACRSLSMASRRGSGSKATTLGRSSRWASMISRTARAASARCSGESVRSQAWAPIPSAMNSGLGCCTCMSSGGLSSIASPLRVAGDLATVVALPLAAIRRTPIAGNLSGRALAVDRNRNPIFPETAR